MSNRISCVYQISNIKTGKKYVGSTNHYLHRRQQHLSDLRKNRHYSRLMQEEYNQYGEHYLVFSILEHTEVETLRVKEQKWLEEFKPEYNTSLDATIPNPEVVRSPKVRRNISTAIKEKWNDPEYREKCIKGFKRRPSNRKGTHHSDETKEKLRLASMGKANHTKVYSGFISPDGVVYSPVIGLRKFCNEHDISEWGMGQLIRGHLNNYKGWTRYEP